MKMISGEEKINHSTPGSVDEVSQTGYPPITNRPEDILSSWTALEVLAPPTYKKPIELAGGDKTRIASLSESSLPWKRREATRENRHLYYQIVLGSIKMEPAIDSLFEKYGDSRLERPQVREKAILASIIVNGEGQLVESPAVNISSFGWGVMTALNGKLEDLTQWQDIEL
jgi:hypothetical protein